MAELEKLKKKRSTHRAILTKLINKIDLCLDETEVEISDCEALLEQLNGKNELLNELDNQISDMLTVDDIEIEINTSEEYSEKIIARKVKLQRKIKELGVQQPSSNTPNNNVEQSEVQRSIETKSVKLPKLTVAKFFGNPSEYLEFWNQFENSIHKNQSLSNIDKFCYLKSLLGGIAANVIKGFTITPENYEQAVNLLTKTFGQKDVLINAHMSNLLNITPLRNSKNLLGLRNLYYACQTQIRSLNSLGIKSESYSNLLCPILLKLIPHDLTLEFSRTQNETLTYNLDDLMEFLYRELSTRERANAINPENRTFEQSDKSAIRNKQLQRDSTKDFSFRKTNAFTREHKYSSPRLSSTSEFIATAESSNICIFCESASHDSTCCDAMKVDLKREKLRKDGRCYLCLKQKHKLRDCLSKEKCTYCGFRHNKTLCYKHERGNAETKQIETELSKNDTPTSTISNYIGNDRNGILLQTVKTEIIGRYQNETVFCLFDNGSERTFIRNDISQKLKLKSLGKERLLIHTFQSKFPRQQICRKVLVTLRDFISGREIVIEALETDEISKAVLSLPDQNISSEMQTKGINLTHSIDDISNKNKISLLIGADNYWQLVTGKIERLNSHLVALETIIGWSLQGRVKSCNELTSMNLVLSEEDISSELRRFWEIENLGVQSNEASDVNTKDEEILKSFNDSVRFINGRYRVKLPWKPNMRDKLENNKEIAYERFKRLTRNFRNNPALFNEYNKVLSDYVIEGIVEHSSPDIDKQTFYLPHHAVVREDKSTSKLRIVYDASSHSREQLSLNDCLHTGPNLNPNLLELLLKFRQHAVSIIGDIKQAYLQIELDISDRNFTRFFWTENLNLKEPQVLNFTRVLFGIRSSPFLLAATLKCHFEKYKNEYPETFEILNNYLYVDDFISGDDEVERALELTVESINILKDAGMLLRKWQTNSTELMKLWKDLGIEIEESQGVIARNSTPSKVLGIAWNPESDAIYFDVTKLIDFLSNRINTKRFILQVVGRIFDPIGFISPFVIRLKCLLQEIWCAGVKWDEELPNDLIVKWQKWCDEVKDLSEINIPRHYLGKFKRNEIAKFEIHSFSDSSLRAYGCILYLRVVTKSDEIHVSFICSKSRVAPIKTLSLPRLELMGALLSARLVKQVADCLKYDASLFYWTDSTIAYYWIKGNAENFKPFVKNRVEEIQTISDPSRWFYCPGKQNPSDILSRGVPAFDLIGNTFWWNGPFWLMKQPECWPKIEEILPTGHDLELRKQFRDIQQTNCISPKQEIFLNVDKYDSFHKLLRITAWVMRFISRSKKATDVVGPLTAEELKNAEDFWIHFIQRESYNAEILSLEKKKDFPKGSPILSFAPFLDEKNILRVGGRLDESEFTIDEKHPVILPRESKITELIVKQDHIKIFHGGVAATLTSIRTRYWIPKGRQLVKKVINKCFICRRYAAQPANQITSQLPKDRICETPPFSVCGIDFAGPIFIKTSTSTEKAYVALFTCAVTRAIHLELVSNLSTEKFLLAMRRFMSRRGNCNIIYSDNAKTFKCANKEFKHFAHILKHQDVQDFVANKGITWKYIIERAAWWGGFYERLVKSVKECLRKILGKALLEFEELATILTEVESVLNSRPLTYVYTDTNEPEPLTPAHFLNYGKSDFKFALHFAELFAETSSRSSLLKRKAFQLKLLRQIWTKWKAQYLLNLRTVHHLNESNKHPELKVGDVVLLEGTQKSKLLWQLGLVQEVYRGRDNQVRSCLIRTAKGQLKRPVQLLYPLEVTNELS